MSSADPLSTFIQLKGEAAGARARLKELQGSQLVLPEDPPSEQLRTLVTRNLQALRGASAVITGNEVNERHGTGVLVRRLFSGCSNLFSVRSRDDYGGEHDFGDESVLIAHRDLSRYQVFFNVIQGLRGTTCGRITCIPYYASDVLTAIALKDLFGVPLCTYIMDDHNVYSDGISDELMTELLHKSDLRLAISTQMRDAYERKYGLKFWILPPIVQPELIRTEPESPEPKVLQAKTGILIGNVWGEHWLEKLRRTVRASGLKIDWYASLPSWRDLSAAELERDGIKLCGFLPEAELVPRLKQYAFAVLPSGTLDASDDKQAIARLSLPTRVPFLMATAGLPVVVLGSPETAAADFVTRFGIGAVTGYDPTGFRKAVESLSTPESQRQIRERAAKAAPAFAATGVGEWLWESLKRGEPWDERFESLLPRRAIDLVPYVELPPPADVLYEYRPVYQALRRLQMHFTPDFILDVGASSGIWSHTAHMLYSKARFILVEPLADDHARADSNRYTSLHPDFEWVKAAVSDKVGTATFLVSDDLYGSSLLETGDTRAYKKVTVNVTTLDALAQQKALTGRGLVKIDVQCAEHLVLDGAAALIEQVDAFVVELSLEPGAPNAKTLLEMWQLFETLGFTYGDDVGDWRSPVDGALQQKDILFIRRSRPSLPPQSSS